MTASDREIVAEAVKVLDRLAGEGLAIEMDEGLVGGAAYDVTGSPLPEATLDMAREADGILLGAVGGYKWESLDISVRPEKGLLGLRSELGLFSNPAPGGARAAAGGCLLAQAGDRCRPGHHDRA